MDNSISGFHRNETGVSARPYFSYQYYRWFVVVCNYSRCFPARLVRAKGTKKGLKYLVAKFRFSCSPAGLRHGTALACPIRFMFTSHAMYIYGRAWDFSSRSESLYRVLFYPYIVCCIRRTRTCEDWSSTARLRFSPLMMWWGRKSVFSIYSVLICKLESV